MKLKIAIPFAILVLILASCNLKKDNSTPKQVMSSFLAAMQKVDYTTAKKYCTPNSEATFGYLLLAGAGNKNLLSKFDTSKITIGEANISGDKATLPISDLTKSFNINFPLQKIDNEWKVVFDMEGILAFANEQGNEELHKKANNLELYNLDSMKAVLNQKMKDANINPDSVEAVIKKEMKNINMDELKKEFESLKK